MIEIDGSYGEGGGQILRTSIALSAVTREPVRIINIRANRPKPGLKRQHIAGIELVGRIANARVKGLKVGSTEITFVPEKQHGGSYKYDVGTAGSISLVLQAVLPTAVTASEPIQLELRGGTDVAWSPPIDYLKNVFVPILSMMGPKIEIIQKRRGHYPKGGGTVICKIEPADGLKPLNRVAFGDLVDIRGVSHCVRLPRHVAERQAESAKRALADLTSNVEIEIESYPREGDTHLSPGSGIVLWARSEAGAIIGADALGKRGKRAENVGTEAATKLLNELSSQKAIDMHSGDMLVPYLTMASGTSHIGITQITTHLETNIWITKKFFDTEISLTGKTGQPGEMVVDGVGESLNQ